MSALAAVTARCVHCTWRTDVDGDALREQRDVHELMHPGGTVLVGGSGKFEVDEIMAEVEEVLGSDRQSVSWTPELALEALREFAREHGRAPKQLELRSPLPVQGTLIRLFGSQGAAIKAAGLSAPKRERRTSGSGPSPEEKKREPVPPPEPAAEPAPLIPDDPDPVSDPALAISDGSLVVLAQRVSDLTERRRVMLVELDLVELALRETVAALRAALAEHEPGEGA